MILKGKRLHNYCLCFNGIKKKINQYVFFVCSGSEACHMYGKFLRKSVNYFLLDNCALLGYYVVSSGNTDMLSRNVGKKFPLLAA